MLMTWQHSVRLRKLEPEEEEESPTVVRKAESGRRRRAAKSESAPSASLSDGRLENLHGADGKSLIQVCAA